MKTFYKRQVSNIAKRPTSNFSAQKDDNEPVSATFARRQIISKMAQTSPMTGKKKAPVIVSKADIIKAADMSANAKQNNANFSFQQQVGMPSSGLSSNHNHSN